MLIIDIETDLSASGEIDRALFIQLTIEAIALN